jgi:hypothetical protein
MSLCGFVPLVTELVFELNFLLYIFWSRFTIT